VARPRLPATLLVLERGWLSANNIVGLDGDEASVVDSGYLTHGPETVDLLHQALAGRRLVRLINTHSHSDHVGGNAALQRAFGCAIHVPIGMAGWVAEWDEAALLLSTADQDAEPFRFDATLGADALWREGFGILFSEVLGSGRGRGLAGASPGPGPPWKPSPAWLADELVRAGVARREGEWLEAR
jgi:glyoxylase-like metal-dependent hydrolase (beta-lactamase superfamily II)